jgi:hypothetical protein
MVGQDLEKGQIGAITCLVDHLVEIAEGLMAVGGKYELQL